MGTSKDEQAPVWIATSDLPVSPGHPFYTKLNAVLGSQVDVTQPLVEILNPSALQIDMDVHEIQEGGRNRHPVDLTATLRLTQLVDPPKLPR